MTRSTRRRKAAAMWSGLVLLLGASTLGLTQMYATAATTNNPANCGNCQGNSGAGVGNGASSGSGSPGKALTATVQGVTDIAPGRNGTVTVVVSNPNNQAVNVTRVAGSVTSVTSGTRSGLLACDPEWILLDEFNGSTVIGKNATGTVTMPVRFDNKSINQDNCKGVTYSFSFTVFGQQT